MKLTGHKTENIYRRYAIVSDADLQAAVQKLAGTFPGTSRGVMVEFRSLSSRFRKRARGAAWLAHWTVNPEVAGSSPVEPAIKSRNCRTPPTATNVNVTENVTDERGRRIPENFRSRISHRPAAESFCAAESRSASLTIAYR